MEVVWNTLGPRVWQGEGKKLAGGGKATNMKEWGLGAMWSQMHWWY